MQTKVFSSTTSTTTILIHYDETKDTAIDMRAVTRSNRPRIIQCPVKQGSSNILDEQMEPADTGRINHKNHNVSQPPTPNPPTPVDSD
eukprot:12431166-Karenia_brevis.AAC.1